ncbi:histidine phosphatase family protein [Micromonospora sp. WMMD1082]|uniref:histidine phosphatase family protein n=1 Tax=Micromonospora sp. WMMD1082 TaxID=3016104 RepID=UPI0024160C2A|nr:histidine phosphatase family protein [Micromonospora sp. WMMD1082]MDG4795210.1 histidine phosphatase family protein [Micromonospora sp. WMMD1082]
MDADLAASPPEPQARGRGECGGGRDRARMVIAELVIMRHGESLANVAYQAAIAAGRAETGLTGPDAEVDLSPQGRQEAAGVGSWLAALPAGRRPQVVRCSPYRRAWRTWQIAADASGVSLPEAVIDDRLTDRLMGELSLMRSVEVDQRFPAERDRRRAAGPYHYQPPGGESYAHMHDRIAALVADLHVHYPGQRVLAVAHNAVILLVRMIADGLTWTDVAELARRQPLGNASVSRFEAITSGLRTTTWNQPTGQRPDA